MTAWGLGAATFAIASTPMLARGGEVSSFTGLPQDPAVTVSTLAGPACERGVTSLLQDDLIRSATGRPDLGPTSFSMVAESMGGSATLAMAKVQEIHDELVGPATTDLLNLYQRDVRTTVRAYAARVIVACRSSAGL
jgi:hypothetical protein